MNKVIFLNGPFRSSKTTLAKKLQDASEIPFLRVGVDKVIEIMPIKLNDLQVGQKITSGF